jgi:hypothetical protein
VNVSIIRDPPAASLFEMRGLNRPQHNKAGLDCSNRPLPRGRAAVAEWTAVKRVWRFVFPPALRLELLFGGPNSRAPLAETIAGLGKIPSCPAGGG